MYKKIIKLSSKEIKSLKRKFSSLKFKATFDLIYETQIPNSGILLLDGELKLLKRKKVSSTISPGHIIGIYEMMNNEPAKNGCIVMENSELIMLHKTDIMEALSDKNSDLYGIIKDTLSDQNQA